MEDWKIGKREEWKSGIKKTAEEGKKAEKDSRGSLKIVNTKS